KQVVANTRKPLSMNKNGIYVFTCDRPMELRRLLHELCSIPQKYSIYIIDDSSNGGAIEINRRMSNEYCNVNHLGKTQYRDFYDINSKSHDSQLLGDTSWNLGIARNFALDHSTFLGYEKVLFVDDDISGIDEKVIEVGFESLIGNCFVSCS